MKLFILILLAAASFQTAASKAPACIDLEAAKQIARTYEFDTNKMENGFFKHMHEDYVQEGKAYAAQQFPENFYEAKDRADFQAQLNKELGREFLVNEGATFYHFMSQQAAMGCRVTAQVYVLCSGEATHTSKFWDCW